MVDWYRHDIPAFMDGTQKLSDRAFRAYVMVLQLIYSHEGAITINERGLAGICNQHIRTFRTALRELLATGKLVVVDDKLTNLRAESELNALRLRRVKAGKRSSFVSDTRNNVLKLNGRDRVQLRIEKRREDSESQ